MDRQHIDELCIGYVEKLSLYEEYASRIRNLIQDLAEHEDIEVCGLTGWAKAPAEFMKSLSARSGEVFGGNLSAVPDLVTVRILLRFPEDVRRIEEAVCTEFDVDSGRSVPSSGLDDPFRFGYPAVFYTLGLSGNRSSLREWSRYKDIPFRLEIRTVLQEAWATLSPRVSLNVDSVSEKKLKRRLARLAALIEEADEGFLSLWEETKDLAVLVPPAAAFEAPLETPVTVERTYTKEELYAFFNESEHLLNAWSTAAVKAGFPIFVPSPSYLKESFEYLYRVFRAGGLDTLSEVKKFLADLEEEDRGILQLRTIHGAFEKESGAWRVDAFSALFLLVLNLKWEVLKDRDLVQLEIKRGSDRISGVD